MKKRTTWMIAAILTLCGTTGADAQGTDSGRRHEVGISIGAGSNSTILSFLEDLTTITAAGGSVKYDNEKNLGPLAVEYFYRLSPKIGVGGVAAYVRTKKDIVVGGSVDGDAKVNYLTVMPALKLGWFDREHFGMYSKLAAGVTMRSEKQKWSDGKISESDVMFNFQLSLIGLEAGGSNLRAFAELGFGEQGIALAGVRFRF